MSGDYSGFNQSFQQGFQQAQQNALVKAQMEQQQKLQDAQLGEIEAAKQDRELSAQSEEAVGKLSLMKTPEEQEAGLVGLAPRVAARARQGLTSLRAQGAQAKSAEAGAVVAGAQAGTAQETATIDLDARRAELAALRAEPERFQKQIALKERELEQNESQFVRGLEESTKNRQFIAASDMTKLERQIEANRAEGKEDRASRLENLQTQIRAEQVTRAQDAIRRVQEIRIGSNIGREDETTQFQNRIAERLIAGKQELISGMVGAAIQANPALASNAQAVASLTERFNDVFDLSGSIITATAEDAASKGDAARLDEIFKQVNTLGSRALSGDNEAMASLQALESEAASIMQRPTKKLAVKADKKPVDAPLIEDIGALVPEAASAYQAAVDALGPNADPNEARVLLNAAKRSVDGNTGKFNPEAFYKAVNSQAKGYWGTINGKPTKLGIDHQFTAEIKRRGDPSGVVMERVSGDKLIGDVLVSNKYDIDGIIRQLEDAKLVDPGTDPATFFSSDAAIEKLARLRSVLGFTEPERVEIKITRKKPLKAKR